MFVYQVTKYDPADLDRGEDTVMDLIATPNAVYVSLAAAQQAVQNTHRGEKALRWSEAKPEEGTCRVWQAETGLRGRRDVRTYLITECPVLDAEDPLPEQGLTDA